MELFEYELTDVEKRKPVVKNNIDMLRPYQLKSIERCLQILNRKGNPLVIQATGTGKTICIGGLIYRLLEKSNKRILVIAHREELVYQNAEKIKWLTGYNVGIEKANITSNNELVISASVQSLNEKRLAKLNVDYLIIDECHHSTSKSYRKIIESLNVPIIGYTATPDRADGVGLGLNFTDIAINYSLLEAIKDNWLCNIKGLKLELDVNLNNVKTSKGDFDAKELSNAINPELYKIAKGILDHCQDRKPIVFLPSVELCYQLEKILNESGYPSLAMDGTTKDRQYKLSRFMNGEYKCLINMNLFTEGFDAPFVDCIVMARPTKSRSLYSQMIGRGTRLHEGKKDCLLIEFTYNYTKHELVNVYELFITENFNEKVRSKATKEERIGELFDVLQHLNNSFEETYHVNKLLEKIKTTKLKGEVFNPFEVMALAKIDIENEVNVYWTPKDSNKKVKLNNTPYSISSRQTELLLRNNFDIEFVKTLSVAQASKIIQAIIDNKGVNNLVRNSIKNWI